MTHQAGCKDSTDCPRQILLWTNLTKLPIQIGSDEGGLNSGAKSGHVAVTDAVVRALTTWLVRAMVQNKAT